MAFSSIRTVSFRNLCDTEINLDAKNIFLVGENGQGKTNFLEAVYFASYGSSFRGTRDAGLVRTGEKDLSVSVKLDDPVYSGISVFYRDGKKSISINGKRAEDRKELLNAAPCIVFCHEDMEFVSGTPERRRWFFDQTLCLPDPVYLGDLQNYRKVLRSRNNLLKNSGGASGNVSSGENPFPDGNGALLDALDLQLARYGLELAKKRQKEARFFSSVFEPLYGEISGLDGISIGYIPSWKEETEEAVMAGLNRRRENDFFAGLTVSGPHRDRYGFYRKGKEFSGQASTGQRRLLALLLRVAQARVFSQKTGRNPVLLLDDVLLELDGQKRKKFLSLMPEYDQGFFTFLPEEPYKLYRENDTIVYLVESGILKKGTQYE